MRCLASLALALLALKAALMLAPALTLPVPVPKAGRCPRVQAPLAPKLCLERNKCSRDDQCMENRKCCFSSCAMRCMVPATGP
ncbi:PREDICTED: whey acidic protein-like [Lipotes vexillifer]|uniref:Whey acidic protein-like n=1 Tax=Lipotes vexillifer TaxID=118797 RepID=A0A340WJB6_LIPVE|nr:PREDICTED: whey acidic protein-like [Lipotes vexillifer]